MYKEYIVSLKRDVDYDAFWNQIENESEVDSFVPSRKVEIINNRDGSLRSCHYSLTDEEVASGYILACQALPASSKIKISFDE